jgi:hypothetical protein
VAEKGGHWQKDGGGLRFIQSRQAQRDAMEKPWHNEKSYSGVNVRVKKGELWVEAAAKRMKDNSRDLMRAAMDASRFVKRPGAQYGAENQALTQRAQAALETLNARYKAARARESGG